MQLLGWLLSIVLILALSVFGRALQRQVTGLVDPAWLAGMVFLLLLMLLFYARTRGSGDVLHRRASIIALLLLVAGGVAMVAGYLVPVEAVHFLVFSCFGWLSNSVFGFYAGGLAVIMLSFGDEVLQHFLPDRVGDLHDIAINLISGAIGLLLRGR